MDDRDSSGHGIVTLLDLHGYEIEVGSGYWVSMRAFRVPPDKGRPHGLNYALTLHTPGGSRLIGYDNAHAPNIGSGPARRSKKRSSFWDHKHWRETVSIYDFTSPGCLLEAFWLDVEKILSEEGQS